MACHGSCLSCNGPSFSNCVSCENGKSLEYAKGECKLECIPGN